MQSGLFDLPKRTHQPTNTDNKTVFEYVIIDATEVYCKRPPKSKKATTVANKNSTHQRYKLFTIQTSVKLSPFIQVKVVPMMLNEQEHI